MARMVDVAVALRRPPHLHASGPGSVALVPDCGVHRGTVTITVRNTVHIEQSGVGDNSPIRRSDV